MKQFKVYWKTGHVDTFSGKDVRDAFQQAGYHFAALAGVFAIDSADEPGYTWDKNTRTWSKNEPAVG